MFLIYTEINALPFLQKGSQEQNGGERKRSSTTPAPIITDPINFNASNKNLKSLQSVFNGYDVTKIVTLDLSFNQIKNLKPNTFVNFTSLTTLYLNNNQIDNIDYNWFINLSSLSSLNLNNNRLTYLPTGIFYGLSRLVTLG